MYASEIEFPDAEDLFYCKTLNREFSEHESVWDVRNFFKYLMKANPNALELLFSVNQEYVDKDFKELIEQLVGADNMALPTDGGPAVIQVVMDGKRDRKQKDKDKDHLVDVDSTLLS